MTADPLDHLEQPVASQAMFRGQILDVRLDTIAMPDGAHRTREVVRHPGGACVMATLPNGNVLLVRQYRYVLAQALYEFPAGKLDPGESPFTTIQRELEEETGYTASYWKEITCIVPAPGFCDERITLYEAHGLMPSAEPRREEDEHIVVLERSLSDVAHMIRNHEIMDAKTICLLALTHPQVLL